MRRTARQTTDTGFDFLIDNLLRASLVGFVGSMPVSIAFCQISLGVAWLSWLAICWRKKRWLGYATGLEIAVGLFLAACVLSTILSAQPLDSLIGLKKFYLASSLFLVAYACHSPEDGRKLITVFLFFSSLTAGYGLLMYLAGMQGRVTGIQTMALTAGGIFMMAALLSLVFAIQGRILTRWLSVPISIILLAALLLSQSAGSLVSLIIGSISVLILSRRWKILAATAIAATVITVFFFKLPSGTGSTVAIQKSNTWELRKTIWNVGWKVFKEKPVTGHGLIDLGEAYHRNRERWDLERDPWNTWNYGHLHNIFLQIAANTGVIGLAAFIFLLYSVLSLSLGLIKCVKQDIKALGLALSGVIIGFIVNGLAEWNFGDSEVVTVFWFAVGLSVLLKKSIKWNPIVSDNAGY
jgi:O-antigen ligase